MHRRAVLALFVATLMATGALGALGDRSGSGPMPGASDPGRSSVPAGPTWDRPVMQVGDRPVDLPRPAIVPALTIIEQDGAISNASAPISQSGNHYTVTAGFIGGILDERNGSVLSGGGFTLKEDKSLSATIEVFNATNVTLEDFVVQAVESGVGIIGASAVSVRNCQVTSVDDSFWAEYTTELALANDSSVASPGSDFYQVTDLAISNVSLTDAPDWAFDLEEVANGTLDHVNASGSKNGVTFDQSDQVAVDASNLSVSDDAVETEYVQGFEASWDNTTAPNEFFELGYTSNIGITDDAARDVGQLIYLYDGADLTATSDRAPGEWSDAVYLDYVQNATLTGMELPGTTGASTVYAEHVGNLTISQSNLSGFGGNYGVYDGASQGLSLWDDNISDTTYAFGAAVDTDASSDISLENVTATRDAYGYDDDESSGIRIVGCDFAHAGYDESAIYLEDDSLVTITDNDLFNASNYGIQTEQANQLTVSDNDLGWAGYAAIFLESGSGDDVFDNNLSHPGYYGLFAESATALTVSGNDMANAQDRTAEVAYLDEISDGSLSDNDISGANISISLDESTGFSILDNNGSDAYVGIYLVEAAGVTVAGNLFAHDFFGFEIDWNNGVTFYHNDFESDRGWLSRTSTDLINWSDGYPVGGNYWSNHTGPDVKSGPDQNLAGADGIVDTPFVINTSMEDPYPLTEPWEPHFVTFSESGLADGTSWEVSVGGTPFASTSSSIAVPELDGANTTVGYTVGKVAGYGVPTPSGASLLEERTNLTVAVTFVPSNFTVTFTESGLASGTSWSVTLGGHSFSSATSSIAVNEPNGTYAWTAATVTGYALTSPYGNVTVSGGARTLDVTYVAIPAPSTGAKATTSSSPLLSTDEDYALLAGLAIVLMLAILGFALWARGRRPPAAAQPWSPPSTAAGPGPSAPAEPAAGPTGPGGPGPSGPPPSRPPPGAVG